VRWAGKRVTASVIASFPPRGPELGVELAVVGIVEPNEGI